MAKPLEIRVCESCAWDRKKIRNALKDLRKKHGDRIRVVKKDCLDLCDADPAVIVGKRAVAPATPKAIRAAVKDKLK